MEKDKPGDLTVPRKTLKLKSPAARPPAPPKTVAGTGLPPKAAPRSQEPVSWADEHKRRMQADMDALGAGAAPDGKRGR
jgi:hypothetical protein